MARTIVVGDIHGCFDELTDLLELIKLQRDDRLIAVGDLVTKGPKNREVLDLFISDPRFSSVVGNHDRILRQKLRGEPVRLNKDQRTVLKQLGPNRERYSDFLRSLPFTIDLGSHLVVHAGVRPGVEFDKQMASDMTEIRTMGPDPPKRRGVPWYAVYRGPQTILFGHWPAKQPRRAAHAIGLDTGCVYGLNLTAFVVETGEFISIPARQKYAGKPQQAG
jgi:diadenosine tetraphosphatase ApaH/serine/threonine PP2A family protein phosphatase